ncbi:related to WD-repeat protein 8 [Rhynchosporium agropyri]|uniref:Related to WD-repeat protein 8 n=1 Tax=Rhynchosporium agropyri TaxID=914238 RepID=A0A1E1LGZ4_9HELO|nr:related to WD-repeat protein 8 [Rhynchosporium agropyri]
MSTKEPKIRFSRSLKSSTQSLPSPDGAYIATILPSKLSIRTTRSLEVTRVVSLPPELASSISWFLWSSSSSRILLASADFVRVYSVTTQFSATISNPTSGTTKIAHLAFGADHNEICIFSDFGLKLSICNLLTSRSVEINSPKFYTPGVAARGLSYRPGARNLALLTRSGGKDIISIHSCDSLEVKRSWCPDIADSQGMQWSPDGRWLAVWESAAQGHKLLVYTADGHLFKSWDGPTPVSEDDIDVTLGAGIKLLDWSSNGMHIAIGDYTDKVTVLSAPSFSESMSIVPTTAVKTRESLQIWQEQISHSPTGAYIREFITASQSVCPPTSGAPTTSNTDPKMGTNFLSFDNSATLLATRIENLPTTIWIWDIGTRILRAVMIMHAPIAKATWHPTLNEVLMIRCEGEESKGLVYLWEPSWDRPRILDFRAEIPGGKLLGKTVCRWLTTESNNPAVFFSDSQDCILASIPCSDDEDVPWQEAEFQTSQQAYNRREESPLDLMPAAVEGKKGRVSVEDLMDDEEEGITGMSGESDDPEMEDTFHFRKFVEPISRRQ